MLKTLRLLVQQFIQSRGTAPLRTICLAVLGLTLSAAVPVCAQNNQPERSIRVTTGSVQVSGWEQGIVQGNPNLSHFTWMPMSSNVQGIRRLPGSGGPTTGQPLPPRQAGPAYFHAPTPVSSGSHYVKPIHIPTELTSRQLSDKPVHVSEAADERSYVDGQVRLPQRTDGQVSGQLRSRPMADGQISRQLGSYPKVEEQVAGQLRTQPQVSTYAPIGGALRPDNRNRGGQQESREVYGRLTSH